MSVCVCVCVWDHWPEPIQQLTDSLQLICYVRTYQSHSQSAEERWITVHFQSHAPRLVLLLSVARRITTSDPFSSLTYMRLLLIQQYNNIKEQFDNIFTANTIHKHLRIGVLCDGLLSFCNRLLRSSGRASWTYYAHWQTHKQQVQ